MLIFDRAECELLRRTLSPLAVIVCFGKCKEEKGHHAVFYHLSSTDNASGRLLSPGIAATNIHAFTVANQQLNSCSA